jgi:uncharacterized protein YndB with AHSA1/START domain
MTHSERIIQLSVEIEAHIEAVWAAWTTPDGIKSFFSRYCNVDLHPDGRYEILFSLDAPEGQRGSEACRILALQPPGMLSFTWNAPPHLAEVRGQYTHVVVRLQPIGPERTKVTLTHDGWGEGAQWDEAFHYFEHAWGDVVLARLKYRFAHGPVDWDNPPIIEG